MKMKGRYCLSYSIDKQTKELIVEVQLKMIDGKLKNNQNIYFGEVLINDRKNNDYDLSNCVNALYAAEDIGSSLKNIIILRAKEDKLKFKILKETLK